MWRVSLPYSSTFTGQLYRHGDRSPISEYPSDKVPISWWYEGLGQLSKVSSNSPSRSTVSASIVQKECVGKCKLVFLCVNFILFVRGLCILCTWQT